jgi:hypothetical protein
VSYTAWRCWVIEKFCASTTGLNAAGGFAAAGVACSATTTSVAVSQAPARNRNIAPEIWPPELLPKPKTQRVSRVFPLD